MKNIDEELSILRQQDSEYLTIPLPGVVGIETKILKVDASINRVVVMQRFAPGGYAPPHYHHCTAVGYTIFGEWEYDEGHFDTGDVAWEKVGNFHTPSSRTGTEMIIVLDSTDGRMLDNYLDDGTVLRLTIGAYQNLLGKTQAEVDGMSPEELMTGIILNPEDALPPHELSAGA
ncbi:cupin domain-containing protein [Microbulbifer hainanensis]|uniref:cupin domain-containing protein n=1 Tax=Microbulbifer hainanensis TaxID=2735675 RepID=UPI00186650CF|nr:cupin domain-containing protein [Microbulbifer hainanensis]